MAIAGGKRGMTYIQELWARNPLVIDGDTIRPHHKYTDDLYMRSEKTMATEHDYEAYKQYLKSLNLSSAEYEKRLKEWCRRHKF